MDEGLGWARHGIAFVVQDVRGEIRFRRSVEPYTLEREDGTATIAWLAGQPWCDGRIVLTGGSYAAFAAFAGALSGHPAIRGVISLVPAMGTHATAFTDSGVLNLGDHLLVVGYLRGRRSDRRRLVEVMLQRDGAVSATCHSSRRRTASGYGWNTGPGRCSGRSPTCPPMPSRMRSAGPGRAGPPRRRVA